MTDKLQERLGIMEMNSSSPSLKLEKNQTQTWKERFSFFLRGVFLDIEEIPQSTSKYTISKEEQEENEKQQKAVQKRLIRQAELEARLGHKVNLACLESAFANATFFQGDFPSRKQPGLYVGYCYTVHCPQRQPEAHLCNAQKPEVYFLPKNAIPSYVGPQQYKSLYELLPSDAYVSKGLVLHIKDADLKQAGVTSEEIARDIDHFPITFQVPVSRSFRTLNPDGGVEYGEWITKGKCCRDAEVSLRIETEICREEK